MENSLENGGARALEPPNPTLFSLADFSLAGWRYRMPDGVLRDRYGVGLEGPRPSNLAAFDRVRQTAKMPEGPGDPDACVSGYGSEKANKLP